jgi:hypothetical protein
MASTYEGRRYPGKRSATIATTTTAAMAKVTRLQLLLELGGRGLGLVWTLLMSGLLAGSLDDCRRSSTASSLPGLALALAGPGS